AADLDLQRRRQPVLDAAVAPPGRPQDRLWRLEGDLGGSSRGYATYPAAADVVTRPASRSSRGSAPRASSAATGSVAAPNATASGPSVHSSIVACPYGCSSAPAPAAARILGSMRSPIASP